MKTAIHLQYKKMPRLLYLRAPLYAFWGKSKCFGGKDSIPPITVKLDGLEINPAHLSRYNEICDIETHDQITLLYPLTLVFPIFQKILSLKQAPLSLYQVLGKRLKISQHRQISLDDRLDIFCEISGLRIVSKGLEIDLSAAIEVAGEMAWTATETFIYRGDFGEIDADAEKPSFKAIPDAKEMARWFLPGGNGFRFARISGDGNGIHYSKRYARLLGFERDFAQPFLILGNALNHLLSYEKPYPVSLRAIFKGQFYYQRYVTLRGVKKGGRNRFDIYSEGNDRPCISGMLND